ncbi:MAG: ASKHA domain-containing protein [Sedimentisphaeraceae bacterium JB056]
MEDKKFKVIFQPSGKNIEVSAGMTITQAAKSCGLEMIAPCGSQGTCGKCRVRVSSGQLAIGEGDRTFFSDSELARGWRLACKTIITDDITVDLPQSSLVCSEHQILTDIGRRQQVELSPVVKKVYVQLPEASLADSRSDLTRVKDAVGSGDIDMELLRQLPDKLRDGAFGATFTLLNGKIVAVDSGDTSDKFYGMAFDIGTTTVAGKLLCLRTGTELAIASTMNPQVSMGDDVVSRINFAAEDDGLAQLNDAIVGAIDDLCGELCEKAEIEAGDVASIAIAGNTTMLELFCRINPAPLGMMPFISAFADGQWTQASKLGLNNCLRASVFIFPVIGSFVGGDTTACIIASGILQNGTKTLMIDIGTNGELVLRNDGKLTAASTAAGPALEGARISCGMRATTGAIEKIDFADDVQTSIIGDSEPVGICGSAIIDITAELLKSGIVSATGQMKTPQELDESLPEKIGQRVVLDEAGSPEFIIAQLPDKNITITQRDIRELQLASGAIRAGINILLKHASIDINELDEILIAGGFGFYIRQENAQRIGLLPVVSDSSKITYIGNAALAGAELATLSEDKLQQARRAAVETEHTELSLDLDFQMEFASAMMFPENN